jgi:hypothetical protein
MDFDIQLHDVITWGAALLGIGFSAWAFFLKRSISVLDKLGDTLDGINVRVAVAELKLEHLKEWVDRHERHIRGYHEYPDERS